MYEKTKKFYYTPDPYKDEVKKQKPTFDKIIGFTIKEIKIPKDSCGNPDDSYIIIVEKNRIRKKVTINSSEWIGMKVETIGEGEND